MLTAKESNLMDNQNPVENLLNGLNFEPFEIVGKKLNLLIASQITNAYYSALLIKLSLLGKLDDATRKETVKEVLANLVNISKVVQTLSENQSQNLQDLLEKVSVLATEVFPNNLYTSQKEKPE